MSIASSPAAIIFVNNDLSTNVQAALERQLDITESMTGAEFDARVLADPGYVDTIHGNDLRILVIRSFREHTNRELADVAIFIKFGLAYTEKNNFGEPLLALPVDKLYLARLLRNTKS